MSRDIDNWVLKATTFGLTSYARLYEPLSAFRSMTVYCIQLVPVLSSLGIL
jgi:hypothetical protein